MIERSGDVVCGLHHAQGDQERGFLWFGPQNQHPWFSDLGHKITATVSWFRPQNQVGCGLSVAPQNQREDEDSA
jgi:hypothetical protein